MAQTLWSRLARHGAAALFVLLALAFWWLFSHGAASVLKEYERRFAPNVASSQSSASHETPPSRGDGAPPVRQPYERKDIVILVATLAAALWAASRAVYPPEDLSALPNVPAPEPGRQGEAST